MRKHRNTKGKRRPLDAKILRLYFAKGLSEAEIAKHLGIGRSLVESRIKRSGHKPRSAAEGIRLSIRHRAENPLGAKRCIGLAPDRNGILVQCPVVFRPIHPKKKYHTTACYSWTFQRRSRGVVPGDKYVKGAHVKQHPPKLCKKGWTIRDGRIAECLQPFTRGRTDKEYHSTKCAFQTLRWRNTGHYLGECVRRTCAYRNCRNGEGGTKGTFNRVKRSPTGKYYCPRSTHATREREARIVDHLLAQARADAIALSGANGQEQAGAKLKKKPKRGPEKQSEQTTNWYKIGAEVEEQIPVNLRNDRHSIIGARHYVADRRAMSRKTVAYYHKVYRQYCKKNGN
jgi:hypothetical protein